MQRERDIERDRERHTHTSTDRVLDGPQALTSLSDVGRERDKIAGRTEDRGQPEEGVLLLNICCTHGKSGP